MRGDELFAQISTRPPFTKLHPKVAAFFKGYLAGEKAVRFGERFVVNTNFPPYPSRAFEHLAEGFSRLGDAKERRLYSVTLAVTNRCFFNCWHCYNAGRSQVDLPLDLLARTAAELQGLGAVMVTLTGGEPLLRDDLERVAASFDDRSCLILGTTGWGLTGERASRLRDSGIFAMGISLDSADEQEHDRLRGKQGAFRAALDALRIARENGLYPYVVSVATREFLQPDRFLPFLSFAGSAGALEVHLLEPSATGKLAGRSDVVLRKAERQRIFDYQDQVAADDRLPILSSFSYIESADAFGCGAGLTHLYIDGSGEVCPCNLVPLSFGNIASEPFAVVLERMGCFFRRPRCACVGRTLARHIPEGPLPATPEVSERLCRERLPRRHAVPRFFRIRAEAGGEVGQGELKAAYDRVHGDYDEFWLVEAAKPIHALVDKLRWRGNERVFEAGCGTGYATALLAGRAASVLAADLSEGMLAEARKRLAAKGLANVQFAAGDALQLLQRTGPFDLVFSSWVLGYIPLRPFFAAAGPALAGGGRLAFVVHRENSPREALEIFAELVARDPSVLLKRVAFDFPRGAEHIAEEMAVAGLRTEELWEGAVAFRYPSARAVLDHLLKSGAGTAFYDAIAPERREALADEFVALLAERKRAPGPFEVVHDYVACVAARP
jgi:MoaA/NifB/PqqE/SkfB family radical SAM enzyme/protein-L-isoaspartate O-methyltransferase